MAKFSTVHDADDHSGVTGYTDLLDEAAHDALDHTGLPGVGGSGGATVVRKTANETVNGSSTLQDDNDLALALAANEVWEFECTLWWESGATPDIKIAFTVPAGATLRWHTPPWVNTAGTAYGGAAVTSSGTARDFGSGSGARALSIFGMVANGATPGNLQLQWAQNTSDASDTIVYANSTLKAYQLV